MEHVTSSGIAKTIKYGAVAVNTFQLVKLIGFAIFLIVIMLILMLFVPWWIPMIFIVFVIVMVILQIIRLKRIAKSDIRAGYHTY